jgi:hypothetical protein
MNAVAIDSATGWTVVEPASVMVPDNSPELVAVVVGFEDVEIGVVEVGAGVEDDGEMEVLEGDGVIVDWLHPASDIARTSRTASGNIIDLILFIIDYSSLFIEITAMYQCFHIFFIHSSFE